MDTVASTTRRQEARTAEARTKLLAATRELLVTHGPLGFSLADVGHRAGVSRGLAGYHFSSREALVVAAYRELLGGPAQPPTGLGLAPLLAWMESQARLAAERDRDTLALLQLVSDWTSPTEISALGTLYWEHHVRDIEAHLRRGQLLGEIRNDMESAALAPALLGLLHGEMSRVAQRAAAPASFLELVRSALSPRSADSRSAKTGKPRPAERQDDLFG